jgi:hypothetical protein
MLPQERSLTTWCPAIEVQEQQEWFRDGAG